MGRNRWPVPLDDKAGVASPVVEQLDIRYVLVLEAREIELEHTIRSVDSQDVTSDLPVYTVYLHPTYSLGRQLRSHVFPWIER